jgi:sugar phosphate isomerase/epimerase
MTDQGQLKFATDLVTFYAPTFWPGVNSPDEVTRLLRDNKMEPAQFWERIFDCAQEVGLDGLEITFPPGDWRSAIAAFGSAQGFAAALEGRGLALASSFFATYSPEIDRHLNFADPADHNLTLETTAAVAEFLRACASDILVVSLPLRHSRDAEPPLFVDFKLAEGIADLLNRMGATALKYGVKVALHPEAFSMMRNSRDVDLFMLLTDPTYVFLCPDPAQFVVAGSDPLRLVDRYRERVIVAHWKDAVGPAPAEVSIDETIYQRQTQWFAPVGSGVVDWPGWMRLMRDMNFQGWAILELDTSPDPVQRLKEIKRYVETVLGQIYR